MLTVDVGERPCSSVYSAWYWWCDVSEWIPYEYGEKEQDEVFEGVPVFRKDLKQIHISSRKFQNLFFLYPTIGWKKSHSGSKESWQKTA